MAESKTPQFDNLLDNILDKLKPHSKVCLWQGKHEHCQREFNIETEDIEFLKMLRVPPPNYCPTCRRIRRSAHMNLNKIFKRGCDAPNHNESFISIYSEECPFPVFDYKYFIGDEFDPFTYGQDYREGDSPIETLFKLRKIFPMPSFANRDPSSVNSEYTNGGRNLKNGYYAFGAFHSENIWYSNLINKSRNIMDCRDVNDSEYVYDSSYSVNLYKCSSVYFSSDCIDSMMLFDCRNCSNCFGCVNLRNKQYCVFNEQFTKEDYSTFIESLYPLSRKALQEYKVKFWDLVKKLPMNGPRNFKSNDITGVCILNSKDIHDGVDIRNSEHIRHGDGLLSHKDSMDSVFSGGHSRMLYGAINIGSESSQVKFSLSSKYCTECEFIFSSKNLSNCFMCFGLQNKSYCILNKQYTEEEYYSLVDKIKSEMLKRGEYNDGLGLEFSAQAYNFSIGQISYPLTEEQIVSLDGYVAKEPETNVGNLEVLSRGSIPDTIEEIDGSILNKGLLCEISNRPFRITESELEFYRSMKLPLPSVHPSIRMEDKIRMVPVGKKFTTNCDNCHKDIETIFNPKEGWNLFCETCYQQEVI